MLQTSEVAVLQALQEEQSITEFAETLDRSPSYVSETVSQLEQKGFVVTRKDGKRKLVTPADTKAVELLQKFTQTYPHIDLTDILSPTAIPVLYFLDEPRTVADLADMTDNYRNTVNRVINRFRDRGIATKDNSRYRLNDNFQLLHTFATEYVHHLHRQTIEDHTKSYAILWGSLDTFLVQTTDTIDAPAFLLTGPERFEEFELPLLTTESRYYFYAEEKEAIGPEELVCHTLLIDSGTRYQSYCLLLLEKADIDRTGLMEHAERYGIAETVDALLTYLETQGEERTTAQPVWDEFEALAADYGVTV